MALRDRGYFGVEANVIPKGFSVDHPIMNLVGDV